jgi:hypothetical protein
MTNPRPDDNVEQIFQDIELADICFEIGDELGVKFTSEVVGQLDGTVDSIIRTADALRKNLESPTDPVG